MSENPKHQKRKRLKITMLLGIVVVFAGSSMVIMDMAESESTQNALTFCIAEVENMGITDNDESVQAFNACLSAVAGGP